MAAEIERKFLVSDGSWRKHATGSSAIRQGYLAQGESASVRVRIKGRKTAFITIKSGEAGRSRSEFEYKVALKDAEAMLLLCGDAIVEKRRYLLPEGELTWEIDEFSGRHAGLVVAEIELKHTDQEFGRPPWLGDEVTDDPRYRNSSLAREGHPP